MYHNESLQGSGTEYTEYTLPNLSMILLNAGSCLSRSQMSNINISTSQLFKFAFSENN